jgi:aspartate racemase
VIGVLGGMGPLATADFFRKVVDCTPAEQDERHVPLLVLSDPRIPSRPQAILSGGPSPLPALLDRRDRLLAAGAQAIVMPCNTAHHWHAELARGLAVPFPSIVACSVEAARARTAPGAGIAIVATRATLRARLFDAALEAQGRRAIVPDDALLDGRILPAIAAVKAGRLDDARVAMEDAVRTLLGAGAAAVLLACTEAPVALEGAPEALRDRCIDSTLALARATVALWETLSAP